MVQSLMFEISEPLSYYPETETETEIYYDIRLSNELVGRLFYIDSIYILTSN